jgi:hypothetical protein
MSRRRRIVRPRVKQPGEMTTDAGWLPAQLAGVNADAHFDFERSIRLLREQGRDAARSASSYARRTSRAV